MEKYVYRRSDRHLPPASLIVFAALLCGFALVNLFWPKRENSELENRKLAQMPVFSVKTLLNGKWQDDFSCEGSHTIKSLDDTRADSLVFFSFQHELASVVVIADLLDDSHDMSAN